MGEHQQTLTNTLNQHIHQQVAPDNAYQQGITFGIDQAKVALAAPYTPALLKDNPALKQNMHKRIGDMYFEMRLVEDQIAALSGRKTFNGENAIETYKALVDNGAHYANTFQLTPGIALTKEQMAKLTDDIIWYITQEITLPTGEKQTVSVPQVYIRAKKGDIDGGYTYISAEHINNQPNTGNINNTALLNARQSLMLNNHHLSNHGTISAGALYSRLTGTLDNTGGTIQAREVMDIEANKILGKTTTRDTREQIGIGTHTETKINATSRFILDNKGEDTQGYLKLHAHDTNEQTGSEIINRNQNSPTLISADKGITLNTIQTSATHHYYADAKHYNTESSRQDHGTTIQGESDITLLSQKGQIDATQTNIDSTNGRTLLYGAKGIDIRNGWQEESLAYACFHQPAFVCLVLVS